MLFSIKCHHVLKDNSWVLQSVCEQVLAQLLQWSAPSYTKVVLGLPLRLPHQAKPPGLIVELCLSPQAQRWIDTLGCVAALNLSRNKAGNKHINKAVFHYKSSAVKCNWWSFLHVLPKEK